MAHFWKSESGNGHLENNVQTLLQVLEETVHLQSSSVCIMLII